MGFKDLRSQGTFKTIDDLIEHLKNFELIPKFSAGIWYFSPPSSRFHSKYQEEIDIERRLEIALELKDYGLSALEAHYPNEINEKNLPLWQKFTKDTGIKLLTVIPLLFWDKDFEWGSLSNPIEEKREKAIKILVESLELNKELDTDFAVLWPGIDGYENPFGIDFISMRKRFVDAIVYAMDKVPGVRIAFEPKPYEPRGHIIFGTTAEGILLAHKVESQLKNPENLKLLKAGHKLFCLNPEIGHALMAYEDIPYSYSLALEEGRLAHIHSNSQPLGNYDQDLNVGVVSPEAFEALLFVLKMYGYQGYFGIDINPERMPVQTAIKNSIDAIRSACHRINSLDYESIIWAQANPDKSRGWIEAYLIRIRSSKPELLPPLPPLKSNPK